MNENTLKYFIQSPLLASITTSLSLSLSPLSFHLYFHASVRPSYELSRNGILFNLLSVYLCVGTPNNMLPIMYLHYILLKSQILLIIIHYDFRVIDMSTEGFVYFFCENWRKHSFDKFSNGPFLGNHIKFSSIMLAQRQSFVVILPGFFLVG